MWTNITVPEMKKFLGLIVIMGQVYKKTIERLLVNLSIYWDTNLFKSDEQEQIHANMAINIDIFPKTTLIQLQADS